MTTKMVSALATGILALGFAGSANAAVMGFSGPYSPSNATISTAAGGSINTTTAPSSITLFGGSDGSGESDQLYGFKLSQAGLLSFNWNYQQNDCCGAYWDPFGYTVNGVFSQLTNDGGADGQTGSVSLSLNNGDIFAFDQNSRDSVSGFATTVVSNFVAPGTAGAVPEPATWAMMLAGFGVVGFAMRKRSLVKTTVSFA